MSGCYEDQCCQARDMRSIYVQSKDDAVDAAKVRLQGVGYCA